MKCERCGGTTDVTDSRPVKTGVRRRRACRACGHRFTTYEGTAEAFQLAHIANEIRSDIRKAILLLNETGERFLTFEQDMTNEDEGK